MIIEHHNLHDYELHVSYDELRVLVFALDQGQRVYQQRSRRGRLKKILTYNLNLTLAMQKKLEDHT